MMFLAGKKNGAACSSFSTVLCHQRAAVLTKPPCWRLAGESATRENTATSHEHKSYPGNIMT